MVSVEFSSKDLRWDGGRRMKRYGTWVIGILSMAALSFHPTPWCIGCETFAPFGHVYARIDDWLLIWLVIAPFLTGLLGLEKGWLVPLFMVTAQLLTQLLGGEPWLDFEAGEVLFIVLLGLPACFLSLFAGYVIRLFCAAFRLDRPNSAIFKNHGQTGRQSKHEPV
jgi:hypothetical protein